MDDKFSTIAEMKKAAADYANHCTAENYSAIERAIFWAHISQALAAERQAAAMERIAAVLEAASGDVITGQDDSKAFAMFNVGLF